jgi:hypothetical protein
MSKLPAYYIEIWATAPGATAPSMIRIWDKRAAAQAAWDSLHLTGWHMFTPRP